MEAFRSWLRPGVAVLALSGFLGLGCGHGASEPSGTAKVSGTVTYTRLPVTRDGNGSPTGLGATGVVVPARGMVLRVFQLWQDVGYDGSLVPTWRLIGTALTDAQGNYALDGMAEKYHATLVELDSQYQQNGQNQSIVQLVADPAGIRSTTPEPDRPIYVQRQDGAGNLFNGTDPLANTGNISVLQGDIQVNFALGNSQDDVDTWAVTVPRWYVSGSQPVHQTGTQPLGSRVPAILDTAWSFNYYYGDPTPSQTPPGFLDLHYYPGVTESPRRSYVVYDPTLFSALEYDGSGRLHYFGTLSGGGTVNGQTMPDDAWDPGAILPLLARDYLAAQGKTSLYPYGQDTNPTLAPDLAPDLAVVEGMGDAMAAIVLQTPYLTDLSSATPLAPRDIRVVAQPGIYSPGNLAAVAWKLNLLVHGIPDAGSPAQWANFNTSYLALFFNLVYPTETIQIGNNDTATIRTDVASFYAQLSRLYENHTEAPFNLSTLFNDNLLIPLLHTYGIEWPGLNYWTPIAADWGLDPAGPMAAVPLTLDATLARQVPNPNVANPSPAELYLNDTHGEVAYAKLALTNDRTYAVSLATPATLPAGVQVELVVDGNAQEPLLFSAANSAAQNLTLTGNPNVSGNPAWHFIRIRLLSQDPSLSASPIQVAVNLTRVS
jgi:hypothetical protein